MLGRYYQIRDDYQNLTSEQVNLSFQHWLPTGDAETYLQYTSQKGFCEDFDEGKISFPLIDCLSKSSENTRAQILGIFRLKGTTDLSPDMKAFILEQMSACNTLDYTKKVIQDMQSDLLQEFKKLEEEIGTKNSILELALRRMWI